MRKNAENAVKSMFQGMPTIRERFLFCIVTHKIPKTECRIYPFENRYGVQCPCIFAVVLCWFPSLLPGSYIRPDAPGVSGPPSPMLLGTIYPPENYINF